MSVQAITWALGVRVRSATHKAVLLVLANRMDPSGFGWPSQKLVAVEAECSDRTVRRVLADLESDGVLLRSDRRRKDGSYSTDAVQFAMDIVEPAANLSAGPEDNLSAGGQEIKSHKNNDRPAANLTNGQIDQRSDCPDSLRLNQTVRKKRVVGGKPPTPNLPEAIESYNEAAERCGWVRLKEFTEARRQHARAAWKRLGGAAGWAALIEAAERQSFLGGANDRGWRMNFDFFVSPAGAAKILEGQYLTPAERAAVPDEAEIRRRLANFAFDKTWHADWGPRPDATEAQP